MAHAAMGPLLPRGRQPRRCRRVLAPGACDLAARGQTVRLSSTTPRRCAGWRRAARPACRCCPGPPGRPGDVVIEAFGCDPPPAFVAAWPPCEPPVWINLEYLSAEPYVERSHGLPSPQPNGLTKWFFYPGFTARTGGLLREPGAVRRAFDGRGWLAAQGWAPLPGERVVSLFCYDNPALPTCCRPGRPADAAAADTGPAQAQVQRCRTGGARGRPALAGPARLRPPCWSAATSTSCAARTPCARPLGRRAHGVAGLPAARRRPLRQARGHARLAWQALPEVAALWRAWNGWPGLAWPGLPAHGTPGGGPRAWRTRLLAQDDLATQLLAFVSGKARAAC
jgi:hypothetical protein